jgi:hypothetical protein
MERGGPARGAHGSQCLVAARCKTRLLREGGTLQLATWPEELQPNWQTSRQSLKRERLPASSNAPCSPPIPWAPRDGPQALPPTRSLTQSRHAQPASRASTSGLLHCHRVRLALACALAASFVAAPALACSACFAA